MDGIWQDRWQALNEAMGRLKNLLQTEYMGRSRQVTLETTLMDLQRTAESLFQFFYSTPISALEGNNNPGFTANYLVRHLLDQVAFDLDVISTAAAQRFYGDPDINARFDLADRLAYAALKPAIDAGLVAPQTTVLTYMAQSARARVIPYAPVALVAIPFTAAIATRDLLATAHEVGHYVFWHGQFANTVWTDLKNALAPEHWCYQWREEMFADIYGALVAGAPIALSGQDLLLDNKPEDYWKNDEEHPVTDLRPRIYCKVLHEMGGKQREWAPFLKQRWITETLSFAEGGFLTERGTSSPPKTSAEVFDLVADGIDCGANARTVDKALCKLFNLLQPYLLQPDPPEKGLAPLPVQGSIGPSLANILGLYGEFSTSLTALTNSVPELAGGNNVSQQRFQNLQSLISNSNKTDEEWRQLVTLHGWVTRGPEEPPNPPKP